MLVTWLAACGSSTTVPTPDAAGPVDAPVHFDARTTCDDGGTSCDVFLSCGCAPTDKCTPASNGLACMPAGSGAAGDPCGSDATCARGTTCVVFAGATTCHPFCDDGHPCPASPTLGACYIEAADRAGVQVGMLCGPSCTLLTQDCPGALGCYPADQAVDPDHGICLSPGVGTQGQSCSQMTNCAPGYGCIDPAGPATPICAKICALGGGAPSCDPGSGATCRKLLGSSANSQTGVCLP